MTLLRHLTSMGLIVGLLTCMAAQPPDCPWPEDEPCPPDCFLGEMLGLEAVCYQIDDFNCCLEVWARYVCRSEPNCSGQVCNSIARQILFTSSPSGFGGCQSNGFCLRCSEYYYYCGGNRIGTPGGSITVYPPTICGEGGFIEIPIPGDDPIIFPLPTPVSKP